MGYSLCNRCDQYAGCCLNYDGKSCRKLRSVEPNNYDRLMDMDVDRFARFLAAIDPSMSVQYWTNWLKSEAKETFI